MNGGDTGWVQAAACRDLTEGEVLGIEVAGHAGGRRESSQNFVGVKIDRVFDPQKCRRLKVPLLLADFNLLGHSLDLFFVVEQEQQQRIAHSDHIAVL